MFTVTSCPIYFFTLHLFASVCHVCRRNAVSLTASVPRLAPRQEGWNVSVSLRQGSAEIEEHQNFIKLQNLKKCDEISMKSHIH